MKQGSALTSVGCGENKTVFPLRAYTVLYCDDVREGPSKENRGISVPKVYWPLRSEAQQRRDVTDVVEAGRLMITYDTLKMEKKNI